MPLQSEQISILRQLTCLIACQVENDADEQLATALQALIDALDATAAAVLWTDGTRLVLRSQAPANATLDDATLQRLSDPARLGRIVRPLGGEPWLAVSMRAHSQPLGRLWIRRNSGRAFSVAERELLVAVGNLLALALENARMCQEVHHLAERRGALLRRLIDLREDHGRSLARELHDEISQSLIALLIDLDTAFAAEPVAAMAMQPHLERLRTGILRLTDEINRIVLDLRPSLLERHGLVAALRWYAKERLESCDTALHWQLACQSERLSPELETAIFRIGQESLSNVARYAEADNVWIQLACDGVKCVLTVRDDGAGFDVDSILRHPNGLKSAGLIGMQERAEQAGGRVVVESSVGSGTSVIATIPVEGVGGNG